MPPRIKLQTACEQGSLWLIECSLKKIYIRIASLESATGVTITDRDKQIERWAELYQELYSRKATVTQTAVHHATPSLVIMEELDIPPSTKELSRSIDTLGRGKTPWHYDIPPEVIRVAKASAFPNHLHDLLQQCWAEWMVPQDAHDSNIITLYNKNKGGRSDCNSCRGISLLSIVGNVFARVPLTRLQSLAERVYVEAQCGFRAGGSTINMIFSLRQLQVKCHEQRQLLYIELTKALDLISRNGTMLQRIEYPPKAIENHHIIPRRHERYCTA